MLIEVIGVLIMLKFWIFLILKYSLKILNLQLICWLVKGFKFVATLVLEFEKVERDDETKYSTYYLATKAKTIILESEIDDVFDPSILRLNQTSEICSERVGLDLGLLIQS